MIESPLRSEDCRHFLDGLRVLGCRVEDGGDRVAIEPPSGSGHGTVECGASGTMMRLLTASLCALPGSWRLDGVPRLRERPLAPLLDSLRHLGSSLTEAGAAGHVPIEIEGGTLGGGKAVLDARESSQYVSALLMAAAATGEGLDLRVEGDASRPYVDLTLAALERFGASVASPEPDRFVVGPARLVGARIAVEADASSACYPAAAAAITGGAVTIEGIDRSSAQGDVAFLNLLATMGADVHWNHGSVRVEGTGGLRAVDEDLSAIPDQVPTLAAVASFAEGTTVIRNVAHLRLKESDRLTAMATELRRVGVPVDERADGLAVEGCWASGDPPDDPVTVQTWDDHRIAMSCALVGLRRPGLSIARPEVVAKSYPDFWEDLDRLMK